MGPGAGLDRRGKSRPTGIRSPDLPARSESLYRLSYPGSNRNEYQECFLGGKGGRCVGLTTLPLSCVDCLEIWEPQPPGTLRACNGLLYLSPFTSTEVFVTVNSTRTNVRCKWPRDLMRGSVAARMLILWVRFPPCGMDFVTRKCRMMSGRDLCVGLMPCPEESYWLWCSECDREASTTRRFWRTRGCCAIVKKIKYSVCVCVFVLSP